MKNKQFLEKIKNILISQKEIILKTAPKQVDIDSDGDETDIIQANLILSVAAKLHERNNIKILQINNALLRISDATYGICEDCEEKIPEKRLLINPYFITCIGCAEIREEEFSKK